MRNMNAVTKGAVAALTTIGFAGPAATEASGQQMFSPEYCATLATQFTDANGNPAPPFRSYAYQINGTNTAADVQIAGPADLSNCAEDAHYTLSTALTDANAARVQNSAAVSFTDDTVPANTRLNFLRQGQLGNTNELKFTAQYGATQREYFVGRSVLSMPATVPGNTTPAPNPGNTNPAPNPDSGNGGAPKPSLTEAQCARLATRGYTKNGKATTPYAYSIKNTRKSSTFTARGIQNMEDKGCVDDAITTVKFQVKPRGAKNYRTIGKKALRFNDDKSSYTGKSSYKRSYRPGDTLRTNISVGYGSTVRTYNTVSR